MDMSWDIVIIGIVCTCIGLLAGWGRYHGKVGLLRMEIKVLKRELSDERERGEAYGKAADEWRGAAMRADAEIAELKEAQRWRRYSEEKPSSDGYYIICGASGFRNADRFMDCKDGRGMDFSFYSYGVEYWMPMPSAPKEAK